MQELLKIVKETFSAYSMEILLFIAGSIGATISDNRKDMNLSIKQKILSMIFGGLTAVFLTSLVVELFESLTDIKLSPSAHSGVGFYIGYMGMQQINKLILWIEPFATSWIKNNRKK